MLQKSGFLINIGSCTDFSAWPRKQPSVNSCSTDLMLVSGNL